MAKICFASKRFKSETLALIATANDIIDEYSSNGFDLTVRQLFYQFVARGLLPNSEKSYNKVKSFVSDGRMAGLIDWEAIKDRTRYVRELAHWASPRSIIAACARQYRTDKWNTQTFRPECWIEKDALVGVIEPVCEDLDVACFSCRGYASQSSMFEASERLKDYVYSGQTPVILHLGDHDPSGLDMTRDIRERLALFMGEDIEVRRIALTMAQVRQFNPPPNPAKVTDARAKEYKLLHGPHSWELDALDPATLSQLIRDEVGALRDDVLWDEAVEMEQEGRDRIAALALQA